MKKNISIVVLTSRGPRHSYFCRRLSESFDLRGIAVDDRYHAGDRFSAFLKANGWNPWRIARSLISKMRIRPYELRDREIERKFFPLPENGFEFPENVPVLMSPDPNSEECREWIRKLAPDVLVVFGTRLIGEPVLSIPRFGALNIHTGLSPYYRGGQCTFWCLYEGDLEHVGVTIHHLSPRIDGGDIVYTAQPVIEPGDCVRSLECKLVQLGTEKMIQAIGGLAEGTAPRIPQLEKGKLFLSKMFTLEKRLELEEKLKKGLIENRLKKSLSPVG